jgi:hypothetical protein
MASIDMESAPLRADVTQVRRDGELVEVVVERSHDAFRLNDTAFALWELCDGATTVREMTEAVRVLFAGSDAELAEDVRDAVAHLAEAGLITVLADERDAP